MLITGLFSNGSYEKRPDFRFANSCENMRPKLVIGIHIGILNDHYWSPFTRLIWKQPWVLTIQDSVFKSDDHFGSYRFGSGRNQHWKVFMVVCSKLTCDTEYAKYTWNALSHESITPDPFKCNIRASSNDAKGLVPASNSMGCLLECNPTKTVSLSLRASSGLFRNDFPIVTLIVTLSIFLFCLSIWSAQHVCGPYKSLLVLFLNQNMHLHMFFCWKERHREKQGDVLGHRKTQGGVLERRSVLQCVAVRCSVLQCVRHREIS